MHGGQHFSRPSQGHDIQTIEEVFAKSPLFDGILQINIRGRYDPHIQSNCFCSSKPLNGGSLEKAQDFYLQEQGQFTNLIQKDRSLVSLFKLADFTTSGLA